jgi:hypothetical protein
MTGLWTEVCITWPTIEMLGAGYNIYVVKIAAAQLRRARKKPRSRAWCRPGGAVDDHCGLARMAARLGKTRALQRAHGHSQTTGGAYGVGVEYAYTMVHHAPQSAQKPQVVPKKVAH